MTPLQNQAPTAPVNVLHDQGVPNTLAGIGLPIAPARPRLRLPVIAVAVAGLVAVLAILAGRVL